MNASGIAIVGMAGRFPGAGTVGDLWRQLLDGVESIRPSGLPARPGFVPAVASMDGVDLFDAAFFGVPPAFAEVMDPQHRVFLEVAWEALEDAGYDPSRCAFPIGVYGGATANTYFAMNLAPNADLLERFTPVDLNTLNANDFLTTRFSYLAGLTGPSHAVQCACSTSLVAVSLACQALLEGQCGMALAGGVSVNVTHLAGYRYINGGMLSPEGRCRAFSASASGTVFGNGAAVVVLKPFAEAVRDRDHIYAVIIGSAVNNDGRHKVGYLAPGVEGQAQVVAEALAYAGVTADTIGYVEAHGTGTPLGDPIEIRALTKAFQASTSRKQYCSVGSIKTNVGHLDAAAGVTGLVKAALALSRGVIPGTPHVEPSNPELDLGATPFYVHATPRPWRSDGPRRAGVSAFGVGGTNAHVVLEEPPPPAAPAASPEWKLLTISARSAAAVRQALLRLGGWLRLDPTADLADVAYTLQVGRRRFRFRRSVLCRETAEAVALLERAEADPVEARTEDDRPVAFVLGAGAHGEPIDALADALVGRGVPAVARYSSASLAQARSWAAETGGVLLHLGAGAQPDADHVAVDDAELSAPALLPRIVGRLWEAGVAIEWTAFHARAPRARLSLPTYPFEHARYWIDAPARTASPSAAPATAAARATAKRPPLSVPYAPATSELQRRVLSTWTEALGISSIGIDDNFFDLGGDSLLAVRVGDELTRSLGLSMPAAALYEGTTVRLLAEIIRTEAAPVAGVRGRPGA